MKKLRSKVIVLDAKDNFSKQKLFQQAWQQLSRAARMGTAVIRRQSHLGRPVDADTRHRLSDLQSGRRQCDPAAESRPAQSPKPLAWLIAPAGAP
jgi:hypothetical protein